jgi:hypothetical protein
MKSEKWKECCIKEIQRLWKSFGSSMNIVCYTGNCPKCNHFIGLTQTPINEAKKFLKSYGLKYET